MVTVVSSEWLLVKRPGSEVSSIVSKNFSFPSNILSSVNEILNVANVTPAGNMTVYGPEV